ncbi:MAG TPA: response regulator [Thermoanaerobaculia bacterium]
MSESDTVRTAARAAAEGAGKTILAIDDEADVLSFLKLVLEKRGYRAVTAANGTEGLIRAHVEQPDLILLDIMMEEMDGWETLRLLKLDETSREIPVVILSARAEPRDKIRALQEGAVDYITKPFSVRDSLEKIRAVLDDAADAAAAGAGP